MGNRFYSLLIANPASPNVAQIEHLIDDEHATLTLIDELPSYTTVSKPPGDTSWAMLYSATALTKAGKDFREEWAGAADRGTKIHELAENLALFGPPADVTAWIDLQDEELRGFAQSLIGWFQMYKPKTIKTEFVIADLENRVAGRADLLATIDKRSILVDFKTVSKPDHLKKFDKAYLTNNTELVARAFAMRKKGKKVDACWVVRLANNGVHHVREITKAEEEPLFQSFLRARWEWEFRNAEGWS